MKPDFCTSMRCSSMGSHCMNCSHSIWLGEGKDKNGKVWRWEFNSRFGPTFLRKDLEPLVNQPIEEDHPAWEPFEKWQREHITSK